MLVLLCVLGVCVVWSVACGRKYSAPGAFIYHSPCCFMRKHVTEPGQPIVQVGYKLPESCCVHLLSLGLEMCHHTWLFNIGTRYPNTGPCTYTASTFQPFATFSPRSSVFIYRMHSVLFFQPIPTTRGSNSSLPQKGTQLALCVTSLNHSLPGNFTLALTQVDIIANILHSSWIR